VTEDIPARLKEALRDRYTIDHEIGRGGMATVYLARDLKHERQVAVKVLRPELAAALGGDRFNQEIKIAANLTHPHILPLHDSGEADGFLYYVMPHIEGESLRDKLAHEGELPIAEAVRILRDVVDALSEAHEHGVVHRDIKPDNVLLTRHHALVTDFGVAKALNEATGRQQLTTEGVTLGTPTYMSPEQAAGDPHVDHRADIYAVGAVAYELLTGRPPFIGATPQEVLAAHVTQTVEPVTKHREAVPPALEQLVMRCLEKKAADRWQTADELLPHLEALTTPSGGMTPTGTMPVDRVAKRRWMMAAAVAGVAIIMTVIGVVAFMPRGSAVALDPDHVVVAVFRNETGDPSLDQLGARIGHWITQGLQRAAIPATPWDQALQSWEHVLTEVEAERITDPVRALAEWTGAGTVVSGAVYLDGDSVEVQVNVTDASLGLPVGSLDPVIGSLDAQRELIEGLRQRVMALFAIRFEAAVPVLANELGNPPTFEAYQAFAEGWRHHSRGDNDESFQYYLRATELDSTWAYPFLRMFSALANLGRRAELDSVITVAEGFGERLTPYEDAVVEARRAGADGNFERALEGWRRVAQLAPGSPDHFILATVLLARNRPDEAVTVMRSFDPDRGWVRDWQQYWRYLGNGLYMLGEYEEMHDAAQRAVEIDPDRRAGVRGFQAVSLAALGRLPELNEILGDMTSTSDGRTVPSELVHTVEVLRANGHHEVAGEVLQRISDWFEGLSSGHKSASDNRLWYSWLLFLAGQQEDALRELEALVNEYPDSVTYRGKRGFVAAISKDAERAAEDDEWLAGLDWLVLRGSNTYWRGVIAGALGEPGRAVMLLQQAYEQGFSHSWYDMARSELDPLRDYPAFQELIRPKG
jgi:tetratricopeptide (TPR) repeat protein/tRNA A-37 threonylcarbamoyl transferase component Bud32